MKVTLTRLQIDQLFRAMDICKLLEVPSKFRYALMKNTSALKQEILDTASAFPRPDDAPLRAALQAAAPADLAMTKQIETDHAETIAKREKWEKELSEHMKGKMEVELHMAELPEIDDTYNFPREKDAGLPGYAIQRARQNQAIVEALSPMIAG